ncbi:MAG: hypothetical protein HQL95_14015, partial [Magnetococcales bacterium]|nr:hypothetical protein [Magnetococcales bacterium]
MPPEPSNSPQRPIWLVETLLALGVILFAQWTLTAHVTGMGLEGNFLQLRQWCWWIPVTVYPLFRWLRAPDRAAPGGVRNEVAAGRTPDGFVLLLAASLVAIHATSATYFPAGRLTLFWFLSVILLGRAWVFSWGDPGIRVALRESPERRENGFLLLLVLLAMGVTLLAHYPDADDQYYSNLAVMTLDHPERPLLSWNGMLWSETLVPWLPVDRLSAVELLVALIASGLEAEPIAVAHLGLAPLAAGFAVLAHGALLRQLAPTLWLPALMVELFLLLAMGGEIRGGYEVFSFVQLQFGKTVLFLALTPLLLLYALRFSQTGGARDWLMLCVGQMAAVGCSSSALFLAPVVVGVGLTAHWWPERQATKRVFLGLLSCFYPLGMGLTLFFSMSQAMQSLEWSPLSPEQNLTRMLGGDGVHLWWYLFVLTGAWGGLTDPRARRTLLGFSWVFVALFFNPFVQPLLARYLTGPLTTWRLFYAVPLPLMAALLLVSLVGWWQKGQEIRMSALLAALVALMLLTFAPAWRGFWSHPFSLAVALLGVLLASRVGMPRWRGGVALFALIAFLAAVTHLNPPARRTTLAAPRTLIHLPGIKAPEPLFSQAVGIVQHAPPGRSALLPEDVGVWVTTLRHHPLLVGLSKSYLEQSQTLLESGAVERRGRLLAYVSGQSRPEEPDRQLIEAVGFYRIGIVAVRQDHL